MNGCALINKLSAYRRWAHMYIMIYVYRRWVIWNIIFVLIYDTTEKEVMHPGHWFVNLQDSQLTGLSIQRWWCRASCPRMSVDILGTNCDQCTVQCCFTSTKTVRLIRTESPGRPPRLSHSSWTLNNIQRWEHGPVYIYYQQTAVAIRRGHRQKATKGAGAHQSDDSVSYLLEYIM